MTGLLTDLYELTMAAGYLAASKHLEQSVFEMSARRLPRNRDWIVVAGVEQAVDQLVALRFQPDEIEYLRGLPQFQRVSGQFFEYLNHFRFTGDVDAVPEGTVLYTGEPLLTVRAPLIQAQIPETYLLAAITFQTLVATKAARMVNAAEGLPVLEFGTRRAHTAEAGTLGARAAYLAGCTGTSNALTGFLYGVPVFGTSAHSWVMSFASETEAFQSLQSLLGEQTVQLIDTYDPIEGAHRAAALGKPLWGVRIDSGDLLQLSRQVRVILDDAGLHEARIMVSGDLDEHRIRDLIRARAPVDAFGVGTELAVSADAPAMGMVYKMVELTEDGRRRFTAKRSADKPSVPGAKQIWRFADHDVIALADERHEGGAPLLRPFLRNGQRVNPAEELPVIRERAAFERTAASGDHRVERSAALESLVHEKLGS